MNTAIHTAILFFFGLFLDWFEQFGRRCHHSRHAGLRRRLHGPAVDRKNYYGSGSEWSGRLAMMLFSIFATLALWKINPRRWLSLYFAACAQAGSKAPDDGTDFLYPGTCRQHACPNCRLQ